MSRRLHVGVFSGEADVLGALADCRARGLDIVDLHSPYPIHGVDEIMGIRRSRLPAACLAGGVVGLALALWFQYWSSAVDWAINVGGKPWDSLPAFIPVAFEMTVLLAGLATVGGLLLRRSLRPGRRAHLAELGATDDRFVLVVARPDAGVSDAVLGTLWSTHGAVHVVEMMEDDA